MSVQKWKGKIIVTIDRASFTGLKILEIQLFRIN